MSVQQSWSYLRLPLMQGIILVTLNDLLTTFVVSEGGTLTGDLRLLPVATPTKNTKVEFVFVPGQIVLNSHTLEVFGYNVSQDVLDLGGILTAYYTGVQWVIDRISTIDVNLEDLGVTSIYVEKDDRFPIEYLKYIKDGDVYDVTDIPKADGLLAGGTVIWNDEYYDYNVSSAAYYIQGDLFLSSQTLVSLSTPDSDNDRIDVIAVDSNGDVIVIEGTPAATPVKPQIDPSSQIELTSILVLSGTTYPTYLEIDVIYNENLEWTTGILRQEITSTSTYDFEDTAYPFKGGKNIDGTDVYHRDMLTFDYTYPINVRYYDTLSFRLCLKEPMGRNHFYLYFYIDSTPVAIAYTNGKYDRNLLDEYQIVALPLSDFYNLPNTAVYLVNGFRIGWYKIGEKTAHDGFQIDYIKLERGIDQPKPGKLYSDYSIEGDGTSTSPFILVGDEQSPGNSKYYGTDSSGEKGYHSLPEVTLWEADTVNTIRPKDSKTVNASHLSGRIDGGII